MLITYKDLHNYWNRHLSATFKKRRLDILLELINLKGSLPFKILEVGCSKGLDAIRFLKDGNHFDLYGVDLIDRSICQDNFHFLQCDAEELPYEDGYFDAVISIGTLEHIEPMSKLCRVIEEINRVSKAFAVVVPSVGTILEPHTMGILWPMRLNKKMVSNSSPLKLNLFTDHTWTKFHGFENASVRTLWYLPPLIKDTVIYKKQNSITN